MANARPRSPRARTLWTSGSDGAVSEILSTVLLIGVAVTLVGGFGAAVLASTQGSAPAPTGAFSISAAVGDASANVTFVSGAAFPAAEVVPVIRVNGSAVQETWTVAVGGEDGRFGPGDVLRVNLSGADVPLQDRETLRLFLVHKSTGKLVGMASHTVLTDATAPVYRQGTPSAGDAAFNPSTLVADGTSVTTLTVRAGHTYGLTYVHGVTVDLTAIGGSATHALRDDGAAGDAVAGDGVYTTQVTAPSTAAGQTMNLTIVVTDALGATASTSATLTLVAAGSNAAPTASFTYAVTDLTVDVNASGSSDSDGTIRSYAWDWGDGSTAGSGVNATHTYAAAGTYTVTLTVTDDAGATDATSANVTVASTGETSVTCPATVVQGSIANCANLQGDADGGAVATLTEGSNNPKLLDIRFTGSGTGGGTTHTLHVRAQQTTEPETLYVQVSEDGGATWTTLLEVTSPTMTTYTAPMTSAQFNSGNFLLRFADVDTLVGGSDPKNSDWAIDFVKVVSS